MGFSFPNLRIGSGFDSHRLIAGRPLILGGVTVPFNRGLEGHSDADVLSHAVIDALLGSACLGDIGRIFPNTDPEWKDVSSLVLLTKVGELLKQNTFSVVNVDATLIAEAPKLAAVIPAIQASLAGALDIPSDRCSVKAKTAELMGALGRGEGIACHAVALLIKG